MLIRVEYRNGRFDMVQDYYLEALIGRGYLRRFLRAGRWAEVDRDPLRRQNGGGYSGPERRSPVTHRPLELPVRIGGRTYQPFPLGRTGTENKQYS